MSKHHFQYVHSVPNKNKIAEKAQIEIAKKNLQRQIFLRSGTNFFVYIQVEYALELNFVTTAETCSEVR